MNSTRKIAVITGVLFIIATVTVLLAAKITPDLTGGDYLTRFSANANQVATGVLFYLIAAFASAGIAISLYPVLKKTHGGLALGAVVFRTIEAVMYIVSVMGLLSALSLGQQLETAGVNERGWLQATGDALLNIRQEASLLAVFACCLGAFLYYYLFFQARLLPRWLSGWGIVAIILMVVACVAALFSGNPVTGYTLLVVPFGLQEMVLAVWLIVKGFQTPAIASESLKTERPELVRAV